MHSADTPVHRDETRGLDHGAYVPLVEMYPDADIPVLQMSMPTLDPRALFELGRKLAPLRDQGTLIVGSGFTTHNLRWFNPAGRPRRHAARPRRAEFDNWAAEALERQDVDAHPRLHDKAPAAREAHPRTEHWAPLYVSLGAAYESGQPRQPERHRRLLVRPEQAVLAVRLTLARLVRLRLLALGV